MVVTFQKITFQNILSFGAIPTTINFNSGVNLISGKNGSGKSAMIDALSFCLFGQPYRKIKIKELLNRNNKKNLKVICDFKIDNKDQFTITRGLNPNTIEIIKNGEELELLSSKRLNQEEIDKIVGLDHTMFRQVISLAVNYNKPFLSLSAMEKRDIIEQIFNIKVFGQMLKIIKKRNVDIKTKNEINDRTIGILEENLKSLRKRVTDLTEAKNNFQTNKENDLNSIDERIKRYHNERIKIRRDISKFEKSVKKYSFDEEYLNSIKKDRDNVIKKLNGEEYAVKNANKTIKSLEKHTICPTCKTEITKEHKDDEIERLNKIIENSNKEIKNIKSKRKKIEDEISTQEENSRNLNNFKFNIKSLKDKLKMIDDELSISEERRNETLNRELDFNLESIVEEFEEKKEEYKILWNETKTIKKNLKNNDIVQSILSESGIKAYFFKKLVPILNSKINEYIKLFELPSIIKFDEFMNETITNVENLNNNISYYSYSEGEKKRIDMSILLSFINITKNISNWNCNLLIIDELLDSAIDEAGLEKLVGSLKNMTYDNKSLCIYIISHRIQQEYSSQFKNCMQVHKDSYGFSQIESI
jgi:DNA repair exonuclease SbcCD ATPase subunit